MLLGKYEKVPLWVTEMLPRLQPLLSKEVTEKVEELPRLCHAEAKRSIRRNDIIALQYAVRARRAFTSIPPDNSPLPPSPPVEKLIHHPPHLFCFHPL